MAKWGWRGDAPAQARQVKWKASGYVAETSDLICRINRKPIRVEAESDSILAMFQNMATALSQTSVPQEFREVIWTSGEELNGDGFLLGTSRIAGRWWDANLEVPLPTVDVDTIQQGGPGVNETQQVVFDPVPDDGYFTITWDLGGGGETSQLIQVPFTADSVKAAMLAGMASTTEDNLLVSGAGTAADPLQFELADDLAETDLGALTVDTDHLAGGGEVFVSTQQDGMAGGLHDTFLDAGGTSLAAHTSDSGHTWSVTGGIEIDVPFKIVPNTGGINLGRSSLAASADTSGTVDVRTRGGSNQRAGVLLRYSDDNNYLAALIQTDTDDDLDLQLIKVVAGTPTTLDEVLSFKNISGGSITWRLTIVASGDDITATLYAADNLNITADVSVSATETFNNTQQTHGVVLEDNTGLVGEISNIVLSGGPDDAEIQEVWTNGSGGTLTLTRPETNGETAAFGAGATTGTVKGALEGIYGAGNIASVTGAGTPASHWVITWGGAMGGVDLEKLTGDGSNLTGVVVATVTTAQEGSPPLGAIWRVVFYDTISGIFQLEFLEEKTGDIAFGAADSVVQAALEALDVIPAGEVTVSGAGTVLDPYIITLGGSLSGIDQPQLYVYNDDLVGVSLEITKTEVVASKGPNHADDELNWEDLDTGAYGFPDDDDDVIIQLGDQNNSILYGLEYLAGKYFNSVTFHSLFTGRVGHPPKNPSGYVEYRPTHFQFGAKNIYIGNGQGAGQGRLNLDTLAHILELMTIYRTSGPLDNGQGAVNWKGDAYGGDNKILMLGGVLSIALNNGEAARVALEQHDGTTYTGKGVEWISVNKTGGQIYADNTNHEGGLLTSR